MRHRALAAEIRHRHDRAAAARLHQRLGRAGARDERIGGDVQRHPEPLARRIREAALEILRGREGNRVDEQIQPTVERLADLGEDARDVLVGADVALGDERARDLPRELADVRFDALALVGEGQPRSPVGEALRDRPRDRALVRDAQDQSGLAFERSRHAGESTKSRID